MAKKAGMPDMKKKLSAAKHKLKVEFAAAKKKLAKSEKEMEHFIEKNPKKAAAIAAGVGAAVGAALTAALIRHRRKKH